MNIVELDAFSRVFNQVSNISASDFSPSDCPGTVLYDICNAFPSVAHVWLFSVLRCLGVLKFLLNISHNLYTNSMAYSAGLGTGELLFQVLAGVRTGCPLSATLFVLVFNPILDLLIFLSDGLAQSRSCMCADDVGSALRALNSLKIQHSVFRLAARVSGMHLKPSKCFIIVSLVDLSEFVVQSIRAWLREHIPDWADFQIVSAAKYLGVFIGRGGASKSFEGPTHKYFEKVSELADSMAPALPSVLRYNERVATVFSYVAQVIAPLTSLPWPVRSSAVCTRC